MTVLFHRAERSEAALLRGGALGGCAVFSAAVAVLLAATDTAVDGSSLAIILLSLLTGGTLYARYTLVRPDPYLAPITGGLTLFIWAGFLAGTTALAALRTGAPLIDANLARADAAIGIHTPMVVAWLAQHGLMTILAPAYRSTVPLLFAALVLLGVLRREIAVWELCFSFTTSAAICTLLSALIPAAGTFAHYHIPADVIAALPQSAGSYYLQVFDSYHSGSASVVDIRHFEGVVTFPSFHTAMALMLAYSLRSVRWLFWPASVWCALTILATMPMGGHYFVDIIAGAGIWALSALPYPCLVRGGRGVSPVTAQRA